MGAGGRSLPEKRISTGQFFSNDVSNFAFSEYVDEIPWGISSTIWGGRVTGTSRGNTGPLPGGPERDPGAARFKKVR